MANKQGKADVQEPEFNVSWSVDMLAGSAEEAAVKVAMQYFQPRIAQGESGSACVFYVTNSKSLVCKVDLASYVQQIPAEQLDSIFGYEHPSYLRETWRDLVQECETVSGYWTWVQHQLRGE